ncbi:MAG TPA: hypothetical protein VEH06_01810 [Candidatus Bathyarchaeia archaeon]|nr:hypothetical protein [Candidatus Bathyarchaeia archaeon]
MNTIIVRLKPPIQTVNQLQPTSFYSIIVRLKRSYQKDWQEVPRFLLSPKAGTQDFAGFGNMGTIPAHSDDKNFYLGLYHESVAADEDSVGGTYLYSSSAYPTCPACHTNEYFAGFSFGHYWEYSNLKG